jgi:integrase
LYLEALKAFVAWAGENIMVDEISRKKAGEFISFLLDGTRTAATVDRYRSTLATLWRWLGEKGFVERDRNPWLDHPSIRTAGKAKAGTKRKGLTDEQLVKLLSGTYAGEGYRQAITDLVRLGLVTGARLEELGDMKRAHAKKLKDGYWLSIEKGKTKAAARLIPLHKAAEHIIARRLRGKGEHLFGELTPGPYGRRTHHVSKAYGRFRKQVGVGERGADFHALRHTFTSVMEGAGVALSTIQLFVGHSRKKTMGTTAVYTRGERVDLRQAIGRLRYSKAVMRLLAQKPVDHEVLARAPVSNLT